MTMLRRLGSVLGLGRDGEFRSYSEDGRAYKVYVPSYYHRRRALPLLLMLHGCTQDPDDFAAGTEMNHYAERFGLIVVYPEQPKRANDQKCWNWFRVGNQLRDAGEPAELVAIVERVGAEFAVDRERIYVAGISAGACMAITLAATYPDVFAGVGTCAGVPYRAANTALGAYATMRGSATASLFRLPMLTIQPSGLPAPPLIAFQGSADDVVAPINGERLIEQWTSFYQSAFENASPNFPDVKQRRVLPRNPASERAFDLQLWSDPAGRPLIAYYLIDGLGHCWPGGSTRGSFTDSLGPRASRLMLDFLLRQRRQLNDAIHH